MLVLADKYDMAYVRGVCCQFLSFNASNMSLKYPLESPQNLLRGASMVCQYSSKARSLAPYRQGVLGVLGALLTKLVAQPEFCRNCLKMAVPERVCGCDLAKPRTYGVPIVLLYTTDKAQCARLVELVKSEQYPQLVIREVQVSAGCN